MRKSIGDILRSIWGILAVVFTILNTSCSNEDDDHNMEMQYGDVTFTLSAPYDNKTRSLTLTDENEILNIQVFVFDRTSASNFIMMSTTDQITNVTGETNKKTFKIKLPAGNHDIVILANCEKWIEDNFTTVAGKIPSAKKGTVLKLSDIKETLKTKVAASVGWTTDTGDSGYNHIPMIGTVVNVTVDPISENTISDEVILLRSISKVDVELAPAVNNFELYSVRVYNYNTQGYVFGDMYNSNGAVVNTAPHDAVLRYSIPATETDKTKLINEIYLLEFDNQFDTIVNPNIRDQRACLVLGGYFENEPFLSYYRVDFRVPNDENDPSKGWNYLDVTRNTHFKFEITEVKESGWPDENLAFKGVYKDFLVEITNWEKIEFPNTPL